MKRDELTKYLNNYLCISEFEDYGPNGLQIEGALEIKKIAFSVSATVESVQKAQKEKAQALIVHHGLFWHMFGPKILVGAFKRRVSPLICNNINLYGYHLPLDAHREVGNAVGLARLLDISVEGSFGNFKGSPTGICGRFNVSIDPLKFKLQLERVLGKSVVYSSPDIQDPMKTVGIITGGANNDWILAKESGLDAYITGEMSEHNWHDSREAGIHMFAGGHHATERFGVLALKKHLEEKFQLECFFIDSKNPV